MLLDLLLACAGPSWTPGELWIHPLWLDPGGPGVATLIVGPDGTTVLLDLGNDRHALTVAEAVEAARGDRHVDAVVLTTYEADHIGGIDDLLTPGEPEAIEVGTVYSRGPWDLEGADRGEFADACAAWGEDRVDLVEGDTAPDCAGGVGTRFVPVEPLPLGEGAELRFLAADGLGPDGPITRPQDEGDRSVVTLVSWGPFQFVSGGDLAGASETDMAAWLDPATIPDADVLLLDRHGLPGANGDAWLDRLLPIDGALRNAVIPNNGAYSGSSWISTYEAVQGRLGGGGVWIPATVGGDEAPKAGDVELAVTDGGATYTIGGAATTSVSP